MSNDKQHSSDLPQTTSERQLEEILQDPNVNWSDIRQAMKARGQSACTNAALIRTLVASPRCSATNLVPTAQPVNVNGGALTVNETAQSNDDSIVSTCLEPLPLTAPRRRTRQRKSSKLINQSVNMMDFGVNNFADLEEEVESVTSSAESNYSCDSKGFLGWKKGDSDSNLSELCDSDGFLNWELTASARAQKALSAAKLAEMKSSVTSDSTDLSGLCDLDGFLNWELTASARAQKAFDAETAANALDLIDESPEDGENKTWHIEDYEGSSDNECNQAASKPKKPSFLQSRRSTLKNILYQQSSSQKLHCDACATNKIAELNDVKQVLMKRVSGQYAKADDVSVQSKETHRPTDLANSCTDTRDAIWIDTSDGGTDIEKECRKLYMEQPKGRRERRITIGLASPFGKT